jgi:hypothetical protein
LTGSSEDGTGVTACPPVSQKAIATIVAAMVRVAGSCKRVCRNSANGCDRAELQVMVR